MHILIDGTWQHGSAGVRDVINPATEEIIGPAAEASADDALRAASAARAAFPAWARTAPEQRSALLSAVAQRLEDRRDDLARLISAETGVTLSAAAQMQVPVAVDRFRYYAEAVRRPLRRALPPSPTRGTPMAPGALMNAVVQGVPVGVAACIVPYNSPLSMMAGKVAAALATGNTVVMKAPPQNPLAVIELARVMHEVGFPPGVINLVVARSPDPSAALVASDDVDLVSFTGSVGVGAEVAAVAGRSHKRTVLELGGKGAAIVLADADLDKAVTTLTSVWGFNAGQFCQAPSRAIVQRGVADELASRLVAAGAAMPVGDPRDPATVVGPLISAEHRARVEGYISGAREQGAELALGGDRVEQARGFYVAPTLLVGCEPAMTAVRTEIFGPVICLLTFDTEDEAIELANDTRYGLYDYVFTRDTARAYAMASQLRTGGVGINTSQRHMEAPFGGMKQSGIGREGGLYSLYEYVEWQTVTWAA